MADPAGYQLVCGVIGILGVVVGFWFGVLSSGIVGWCWRRLFGE